MVQRNISRGLIIGAVGAAVGIAGVAVALLRRRRHAAEAHRRADALVDEASEDSFPASDPPSYSSPSRVGAPPGPLPQKGNGANQDR